MTPTNAKEPAVDVALCARLLKTNLACVENGAKICTQLRALLAERSLAQREALNLHDQIAVLQGQRTQLGAIIAELVRLKRLREDGLIPYESDAIAWSAAFAVVDAKEKLK